MTRNFQCGDFTIRGYFVKAGTGWEIGYRFNNKTYFVSNFIDATEARKWWTLSQKWMTTFCKTECYPNMNKVFFGNFMGNFMYTHYYEFLRGVVSKNYTFSTRNYRKDVAQYKRKVRSFYAA